MIRVRKTKNGTLFQARVNVMGSPAFKSFATRKEAEAWVNETRYLRDKGGPARGQRVTVQQMFDAYIQQARREGVATGTLKSAESRFKLHVLPGYGPHLDMTTTTFEEHAFFLTQLEGKKTGRGTRDASQKEAITAATRNRVRTLVRRMFSVAIKTRLGNGAFTSNPFDAFEPATEVQKAIEYLNQEELTRFLEANRGSHYFRLLLTLFKTGIRIGEALGAEASQIDRRTRMLTVDRRYCHASNKVIPGTKNHQIRHVYLVDELLEALDPKASGRLFLTRDGRQIRSDYFRKFILPDACEAAKVKQITPHATRHTFAAHYLMEGGSLWDLSKILGHSSTEVTEKRYGHFDLEHVRARMRVVEKGGAVLRVIAGGGAEGGAQ